MLRYSVNVLIFLALSVWIGSILFFGAGVASVLFQEGMLPGRTMAGAVNTAILKRLGMFELSAGVVLVGGFLYTAFRYKQWMNWVTLGLSILMLGTAFYYTTVLFPKMNAMREEIGDFDHIPAEKMAVKEEFDKGHEMYSSLAKGVFFGGIVVLMLQTAGLVRYGETHARRVREHESRLSSPDKRHPDLEEQNAETVTDAKSGNGNGAKLVKMDEEANESVALENKVR